MYLSIFVQRISPPILHVENSITTWSKGLFLETNSLPFIFLFFLSGLNQIRFSTILGASECCQGLIHIEPRPSPSIRLRQHCMRKLRLEINKNLLTEKFPECSKCIVTKTLFSIKFKKWNFAIWRWNSLFSSSPKKDLSKLYVWILNTQLHLKFNLKGGKLQ